MKYNCAFQITSFDCDEVTLPDWKSNFSLARSSVTPNWHTGTCSKWNYEIFASLFHRWRGDPTHHQNEYNWWPKAPVSEQNLRYTRGKKCLHQRALNRYGIRQAKQHDNFSIFIYENPRPLVKQREDLMRQKPKRWV